MNIKFLHFFLFFSTTDSLVETFHNIVVFFSYIFVVFFFNFFFIFLSLKFNAFYSCVINTEIEIKKKLVDRITYWGAHREKLSNYLLYVFFMDVAKANIVISIFHVFFLCYFTYLLYSTNTFVVSSRFLLFYCFFLCFLNIIFLVFRHFFFNRLLYWLFIIFFGMFNWFLFFSFLFVYFQIYDFVSFKWFSFQKQVDISYLHELLNCLCIKYIGYLNYSDSSLFFLHSMYDVQLFFWVNFYDTFHTNPLHYYFILYFPLIRLPLTIFLGIFFHIFLVLFFNFFVYFIFYCYTICFIYKYSFKEIYQICSLFCVKVYYFYLGYVLFLFYLIFFYFILYKLFTSFSTFDISNLSYCTSYVSTLPALFKRIGIAYYNSVMSTIGSSNYESNNGKFISVVTNTSLERGEKYHILALPKHISEPIKRHGLGDYEYLVFRVNKFSQKLEALFVKMNGPAQLSCSFDKRKLLVPQKMMGLPNLVSDTSEVYSVVSPNVSTKVDGHPILNVSAFTFECDLSKFDLLVLLQPNLDKDHYVKLINKIIQSTFSDRNLVTSMGCIHFCSTGQKDLPYDLVTTYDMSLLATGAAKKSGSVQFVSLHGSNIPNNHVCFYEEAGDSMLFHLLKNDPVAASMLVNVLFKSIRVNYINADPNKRVMSDLEVEKELFKLNKEYGDFDESKLTFTRSDLPKLSTPGYVGISEISNVLSIEQIRISSEQAEHQISSFLTAKYGLTSV